MPIGLAAGLMLAGTAGSAAASLGAAKMQSNAAKNAQKAQQAGTDRALAVQQQANQPYMDVGKAAAGRLQQMSQTQQPYTQVFGNGAGAQAQPPGMFAPPQGPQGPPPGSLAGLGQAQSAPGMGQAMQALSGGKPPQQAVPRSGPAPMAMPPQGQDPGGGTIKMVGPDGQPRDVPQQFAQQAMGAGFRRV